MTKPFINSWTEFGELEYVCIGSINGCHYSHVSPPYDSYKANQICDPFLAGYITLPVGPRPRERLLAAEKQLEYLKEILEGEHVTVASTSEFDVDIKRELNRMKTTTGPPNGTKGKTMVKQRIEVCRAPLERTDHLIMTPWFKNYYQFGFPCPRDLVITFGNTVLECATGTRARYFESSFYRDMIYEQWKVDRRIHWKTAPRPTCKDSMYNPVNWAKPAIDATCVKEDEVVFEAADMVRVGKDVFYKRSATANYLGLEWLRREFPNMRFHAVRFPTDVSPHLDVNLIALNGPTTGSDGLVLLNNQDKPLNEDMEIFKKNDWKVLTAPPPATDEVSPVAICSSALSVNLLSISPKCVIIEECETLLYKFLDDLGFDVITCPLRVLNEFGGGVHCVTWDIRRNDSCVDYFPEQNYDAECLSYQTCINKA